MKRKIVVIQVACGFSREPISPDDTGALSEVDWDRGNRAWKIYYPLINHPSINVQLWTTGMVAWRPVEETPFLTLASLNGEMGGTCIAVSHVPGLNAFSESYNAIEMAKVEGVDTVHLVTSDFYLTAYKRMWLAAAKRANIKIEIHVVTHHDGVVSDEVIQFYESFQPQFLSRIASSCRMGHWFAMCLVDLRTRKRAREGFKLDGHTRIG